MPTLRSHTHLQATQANRRSQKLSISMPLQPLRTDRRRNKNCGGEINAMSNIKLFESKKVVFSAISFPKVSG